MRALRAVVVVIVLLGLVGCGKPPVMPNVVGQKLDVALSDIKRAGFSTDVEILGGGALGVIVKSNWTVCEQEPAASEAISAKPRLKVDRACGEAVAAPSVAASAPATLRPALTPTMTATPTADPKVCKTRPGGDPCKFGQTAIYSDRVRSGDVNLEITVGAPVEFKLSKDAIIPYDLPPHPVNVYFPITVKNTSPELALHQSSVLTQATNAEQGPYSGIRTVSDGDVHSYALAGFGELPPGKSLSVKEGWSMTTLEGVEFSLSIDGQAGYTLKFTR